MPAVAEIVCRLLERRRAGTRPGLTVGSVDWRKRGGRPCACRYGDLMGLTGGDQAKLCNYQPMFCVCTVFSLSGEMYCQYFYCGLAIVIAVDVGYVWALPRLSCLRWHILGICQDAGEARPPRDDAFKFATHCYGADRRGGVAVSYFRWRAQFWCGASARVELGRRWRAGRRRAG